MSNNVDNPFANEELIELRKAAESAPEYIRTAVLKDGLGVAYIGLSTFWDRETETWTLLADWDGSATLSGGVERAEQFMKLVRGASTLPNKVRDHLASILPRQFGSQFLNDDELDSLQRGKRWIKKLREENNK